MTECPHCEYNKKRAHNWRVEAYRLAGHPLPEQEPFGFAMLDEVTEQFNSVNCGTVYRLPAEGRSPLYTTPQQSTWVGLTDEERKTICEANNVYHDGLIEDIEAKLKEKNNDVF